MQSEVIAIDEETPEFKELYEKYFAEYREEFDRQAEVEKIGITLRTTKVADLLGLSDQTVRRLYYSGKLEGFVSSANGRILFPTQSVIKFMAERQTIAKLSIGTRAS